MVWKICFYPSKTAPLSIFMHYQNNNFKSWLIEAYWSWNTSNSNEDKFLKSIAQLKKKKLFKCLIILKKKNSLHSKTLSILIIFLKCICKSSSISWLFWTLFTYFRNFKSSFLSFILTLLNLDNLTFSSSSVKIWLHK